MVEEKVDLAIRIGNHQDTSLICQRIGTTRRITAASHEYFEKNGEPKKPSELIHHNCIVYTRISTGNEWYFQFKDKTIKVEVTGNFQTNNSTAIREAVLSGIGISVLPIWLFGDCINDGQLKVILKEYQPTPLAINAVYRRGRFIPAKVRCFINFLAQEFEIDPWVSGFGELKA